MTATEMMYVRTGAEICIGITNSRDTRGQHEDTEIIGVYTVRMASTPEIG